MHKTRLSASPLPKVSALAVAPDGTVPSLRAQASEPSLLM
jgi:hypothetical protein